MNVLNAPAVSSAIPWALPVAGGVARQYVVDAVVVDERLITGPNNFIRIYTPIDPNEVGASQRHNGIWDLNAYRLEIPGITALEVQDNYVRIDGLQVWMTTDTNGALGITFRSSLGASDYEVSNSIVRGNGSGIEDIRVGLEIFSAGSGVLKANNNLFYDWIGTGSSTLPARTICPARGRILRSH